MGHRAGRKGERKQGISRQERKRGVAEVEAAKRKMEGPETCKQEE